MSDKNNNKKVNFFLLKSLAAGGLSNGIASFLLNWSDCIKVRLQTQKPNVNMYTSFSQTAKLIMKEEGPIGLFLPGIFPSMLREISYSSIRFGLYPSMKEFWGANQGEDAGLLRKILAGASTGVIGSAIAAPTDRCKIIFQSEAGKIDPKTNMLLSGLRKGELSHYGGNGIGPVSTFKCFNDMYSNGGIFKGLYKGTTPTIARASLVASSQLASYDHLKYELKRLKILDEGVPLHVTGSLFAAVTAASFSQPADTLKSKMMADKTNRYRSIFHCITDTIKHEGAIKGLYKGWLPTFLRFAPHFTIALPLFEQVRKLLGLSYL